MGNNHVFHNRIPALTTACLSTAALALMTLSATNCSLLRLETHDSESLLLLTEEVELSGSRSTIGVLCDSAYSEHASEKGDNMWKTSQVFAYMALSFGAVSCAAAWAVSTFLAPTAFNWKLISIVASITAVMQVPVLLLLEAYPCTDFPENQMCRLGPGSYTLILSVVFWICVTLCTQCMDPPLWAMEMSAWRIPKQEVEVIPDVPKDRSGNDEDNDDGADAVIDSNNNRQKLRTTPPKWSTPANRTMQNGQSWKERFSLQRMRKSLRISSARGSYLDGDSEFESTSGADRYDLNLLEDPNDTYDMNTSLDDRVILRILPNGRRPNEQEDAKSFRSFGDIDSLVDMAEQGKQQSFASPESKQKQQPESPYVQFRATSTPQFSPEHIDTADGDAAKPSNGDELQIRSAKKRADVPTGCENNVDGSEQQKRHSRKRSSDESKPTYIQASQPSQSKQVLRIIDQASPPVDAPSPVSDKPPQRRKKTKSPNNPSPSKSQPLPAMSSAAILDDLAAGDVKRGKSPSRLPHNKMPEQDKEKRQERFRIGIRSLTNRLRMDTMRRVSQTNYAMLDDDMSGGTSHYSSPPIEVKIDASGMQQAEKLKLEDDENDNEEHFAARNDDWHNFQRAILSETKPAGTGFVADFTDMENGDEEKKEEPMSGSSTARARASLSARYRSAGSLNSPSDFGDPEPMYYDSEDTRSELSLDMSGHNGSQGLRREHSGHVGSLDDNSTLSTGSKSSNGNDSGSVSSRKRRSKRRPASPVPSIRSAKSLLDTSIIEETDADIMAETAAEQEPQRSYSMKRTLSAPEGGLLARGRDSMQRSVDTRDGAKTVAAEASSPASNGSRQLGRSSKQPPETGRGETNDDKRLVGEASMTPLLDQKHGIPSDEDTNFSDSDLQQHSTIDIFRGVSPQPTGTSVINASGVDFTGGAAVSLIGGSNSFENLWNSANAAENAEPTGVQAEGRTSTGNQDDKPDGTRLLVREQEAGIRRLRSVSMPRIGKESGTVSMSRIERESSTVNSHSKAIQDESWANWKEQREFGGGIHARVVSMSDDSSHGDSQQEETLNRMHPILDSGSNKAERARNARIRRLATKTSGSVSDLSDSSQLETPRSERSARKSRIGRLRRYLPTSGSDSSGTPVRGNRKLGYQRMENGGASSNQSDVLDALDLQLIEVRRPLGKEYGMDEASL